jgi:hypothetical protein
MPDNCWNCITITKHIYCNEDLFTEEFNHLINELNHKVGDKYVYFKDIDVLKCGKRGIKFSYWTEWNPNRLLLESLLAKYPNCWIKNEWRQGGGFEGVWIGFVVNNGVKNVKIIKELTWETVCFD